MRFSLLITLTVVSTLLEWDRTYFVMINDNEVAFGTTNDNKLVGERVRIVKIENKIKSRVLGLVTREITKQEYIEYLRSIDFPEDETLEFIQEQEFKYGRHALFYAAIVD